MHLRPLGRSGLNVSVLCLGGNVFGWTADEAMSFRLLDAFVAAGGNFIDTADTYSKWVPGNRGGESERIIGRWMESRGNRSRLVIATKLGMPFSATRQGLSSSNIRESARRSLDNLQTDYIDLYISHIDDADTPVRETLEAYGALVAAGQVRAIGASNFTAARLRESLDVSARHRLPRYESLQPDYNLYDRDGYEAALEPLCRSEAIGVTPYFALAAGFLTGKYRSAADFGKSPRGGGMARFLNARGQRILAALDGVAARERATPAQAAIAWLIARDGITAPIASATNPAQLDDLIAAAHLTLAPASLDALSAASA